MSLQELASLFSLASALWTGGRWVRHWVRPTTTFTLDLEGYAEDVAFRRTMKH